MKIVIDIPEEVYKASQIIDVTYDDVIQIPLECIAKGTPLPKGHGDLIDRSKIYKAIGMTYDEMDTYNEGIDAMYSRVQCAPTIIEADKAESERIRNE